MNDQADPNAPLGGIQIDSDWKSQAQAEKAKLSEQSKPKSKPAGGAAGVSGPGGQAAGPQEIPEASFETLISTIVTQAVMSMGMVADPRTGQPMLDLELARHHIDTLSVLETKTEGNLSDEESSLLGSSLYELRARYVQLASAMRPGAAPPTAG